MTVEWKKLMLSGAVVAALSLAGCGTAAGTNSAGSPDTGAAQMPATVNTTIVIGVGPSLVDSAGRTLYFADQELGGHIQCVNSCLRFWSPLTVANGTTPTAQAGVTGVIATVQRPDGLVQVTYDAKPLYTFTQDQGAGQASGNGFRDSFDGNSFVWHVASLTGPAPTPTSTVTDDSGNDYHY